MSTAKLWAQGFKQLRANKLPPAEIAAAIAEAGDDNPIGAAEFLSLLPIDENAKPTGRLTRGWALHLLFSRLKTHDQLPCYRSTRVQL